MTKELNIVYSDNYLKYDLGADNPISKTKTRVFLDKLAHQNLIGYQIIEAPMASESDLLLVHTPKYLAELKRLALNNQEFDADTPVNQGMLEGGLYIIGGTIFTLELALQGEKAVNLIGGMHHAHSYQASGFCIYSDHAIAIRKLQHEGKIKTATIYDLDVHAGQGTQEIFYEDPSVLTVSIHQDPHTIYPFIGFESQQGRGLGTGFNINVPLRVYANETQYLTALDATLERAKTFKSDLNILILGVDTFKDDQLGSLRLTEESFKKIGERFKNMDKLAILFGGGYSTKIPELWMSFIQGYLGV
jgi:acetoin utilization protein AcuC